MERKKVSSSNLKSIGYLLGILEIEFKNNTVYQFKSVPKNIHNRLMKSSSKGTFFSKNIKEKFTYSQVL
ncbi:KTSC domain-containing protein [Flaviramulus aquimarinus]|uniref:KTSC domain-containing protein n=1 Tax=Flaviramulus aquimarinus TaxID=1170456 RepID=A0ABP9FCD2_9FLAO